MKLDKKNCLILNRLQKNCRISLTDLAKEVDLSVDSVRKRVDKLTKNRVFIPKVQIRPRQFGYDHVVDVKLRLHNHNKKDFDNFIKTLLKNPQVVEIFSISGDWDLSIVFIAKDISDLGNISSSIRSNFSNIIASWSESITTSAFKFETYDMVKICGFDE